MAGRKPTPTNIKLIKDTQRVSRTNSKEPRPASGRPPRPAHLSKRAKKIWPKVVKLLDGMSVITPADGIALELLCEAYGDLLEARASLESPMGFTTKDKEFKEIAKAGERTYVSYGQNGMMIRNRPELAIIADAERRLKSSLGEFGLTPATRSKVQALDNGKERNALDEFM